MRRIPALATGLTTVLVLAACSGSGGGDELAAELYEACQDSGGKFLELDGSTVSIVVEGDDARAFAEFSDVTAEDILNGEGGGGLGVSLAVLAGTDCLAAATSFPGTSDQLTDGDAWDGWSFAETEGVGAEFTLAFTSDGTGSVSAGSQAGEPESPSAAADSGSGPAWDSPQFPDAFPVKDGRGHSIELFHEMLGCDAEFTTLRWANSEDSRSHLCTSDPYATIVEFSSVEALNAFIDREPDLPLWQAAVSTGDQPWIVFGQLDSPAVAAATSWDSVELVTFDQAG